MSINVPEAIQQLINKGHSEDEAIELVTLAIQRMNAQKQAAKAYSPMAQGVNDKSMAEYWKSLREQAQKDVYIPPHLNPPSNQEAAYEAFKQNMKNRNPNSESTLRNTQRAVEWFKKQRESE
ncbi:hypothetical protein O1V64_11870 [Rouxiella badensis]|uniref:Uncharacterized protein n=1 Tax=Rouxiella badensis TaxID=1646377 RepID=A0A1X0WHD5_9GAMM|nr:hypothetical protein [Rouxiella badensis]ORJ26206.1 hypothetical protein BS640_07700 [Rouxiella badensis]WAT06596.1 hypothetical protein O1V64_11870 [Rouxiella badensis]